MSAGPPCGNNPNHRMTPGDRAVVDQFRAYLERRAAGGPPEADDRCRGHGDGCMWNRCTGRESTCRCCCPVCLGETPSDWGYDGNY